MTERRWVIRFTTLDGLTIVPNTSYPTEAEAQAEADRRNTLMGRDGYTIERDL